MRGPGPDGDLNTATFRIRRHGSTTGELEVHYTLGGRAKNGIDYEELSGLAVISVDGTIHFVDEPAPGVPHQFFRIAPEPNGPEE